MGFRVGQRVVCVNDGMIELCGAPEIKRGQTYVIKTKRICFASGVLVLGVGAPTLWNAERFRPVTEKQTDITVFTEILNRENKNSRVPVGHVTACDVDTNFRDLLKRVSDHQSK